MINPYSNAPMKYPLKPKSTLSHIGVSKEYEFQDEEDYTTNYETSVELRKDVRSLLHQHLTKNKGAILVDQLPSGISSVMFRAKETTEPTVNLTKLGR